MSLSYHSAKSKIWILPDGASPASTIFNLGFGHSSVPEALCFPPPTCAYRFFKTSFNWTSG
jgi:hypothetical protein